MPSNLVLNTNKQKEHIMSKMSEKDISQLEESDAEFGDLDIGEEDYGFLIDSEGNLKTVFGPTDLFEVAPKTVLKILKIFGLDESSITSNNVTLH
ncbi:hypothetical protein UFOVP1636_326 [uncultured Caudovirales phage]|uniref:Uncharacterized protein n=1 Tax=uncultured Caudovirales phage TaxID=2100421 RepID=A0A6J5T1P6_9CAUD|nr:hypothetical protein UFOVP1636_326 [uncultured Caudovirales phage]